MKKIYIIGLPGCGKTTLAKKMSKQYSLPHIEFDYLFKEFGEFNGRKYRPLLPNEYLPIVEREIQRKKWIIEGGKFVEKIIGKADQVVFIDVPVVLSLWRIIKRYFASREQREIYGLKENLRLVKKVFLTGTKTREKFRNLSAKHQNMSILKANFFRPLDGDAPQF